MRSPNASSAGSERLPPRGVPRALLDDVLVVGQRGHQGPLDGPRHHHPGVLADLEQPPDQGRVPGHERRTVAGEVGLLGGRVDAEQSLVGAVADPRVQHRGSGGRFARALGTGPPVELGVALVGGDDHAVLARPPHHLGEVLDPEHPAGGVRRGVEPQQLRGGAGGERPEGGDGVDRHRGRRPRGGHRRRRWGRRPGGAPRRLRDRARGAAATRPPAPWSRSSASPRPGRRPARPGVPRTTSRPPRAGRGCRTSAGSRERRRRRRARRGPRRAWGRPACRPRGRRCRCRLCRPERGRKRRSPAPWPERASPRGSRGGGAPAYSSCSCGGRSAMIGWSLGIMPSLAAPPGLPRSSKNSTLAL